MTTKEKVIRESITRIEKRLKEILEMVIDINKKEACFLCRKNYA